MGRASSPNLAMPRRWSWFIIPRDGKEDAELAQQTLKWDDVERRLDRLEKQNRRPKIARRRCRRCSFEGQNRYGAGDASTIETNGFILKDLDGSVRASLAMVDGAPMLRLFDSAGRPRIKSVGKRRHRGGKNGSRYAHGGGQVDSTIPSGVPPNGEPKSHNRTAQVHLCRSGRRLWTLSLKALIAAACVFGLSSLAGCSKADPSKLIELSEKPDVKAFQAEINKGFDAKPWNTGAGQVSMTPLHAAALGGSVAIVRLLLDRGMNPQLHMQDGTTPVEIAIVKGSSDIVEELLKRGVDANSILKNDMTPLSLAATAGQGDIVKLLLGSGADVNKLSGDFSHKMTPLAVAAISKNPDIADMLITAGAHVNTSVGEGMSPLQSAIFSQDPNPQMIALLLKYGAEADFTTVSYAREHLGKTMATTLLASIRNPVVQRVTRDTACKDCPIPQNALVDLIMRMGREKQ